MNKETFTKKDVVHVNLEGKDRDRLIFKFKTNNTVLFKFKSRESAEMWLRTLRSVWKINEKPAGISKSMLLTTVAKPQHPTQQRENSADLEDLITSKFI